MKDELKATSDELLAFRKLPTAPQRKLKVKALALNGPSRYATILSIKDTPGNVEDYA